jgi:hypothetical protein
VDQNGIRARETVGLRTAQRLLHPPAGNQCFNARHDREVRIVLRILARGDFAGELLDIGQRLMLSVQETIGLRKLLVLDAHAGDTALLELAH